MRVGPLAALLVALALPAGATEGLARGPRGSPAPRVDDPLVPYLASTLPGGLVAAATCVANADPADGGPTGGTLRLQGVPPGSIVERALLYWSVMARNAPVDTGAPTLDGVALTPVLVGEIPDSACFATRPNTAVFRADVTTLVAGDADYRLAGLPNRGADDVLVEGATLMVIYCSPSGTQTDVVVWEGIDITNLARPPFRQTLSGFTAAASGPVAARLVVAAGNGQGRNPISDDIDPVIFNGVDLDDLDRTLLSGSSCPPNGLYDLTSVDVTGLVPPGSTTATLEIHEEGDCHSVGAVALAVATTATAVHEPSALDLRPGAEPLRVARLPSGRLRVTWEDIGAPAYDLLEGTIGDYYSHGALACDLATPTADVDMVPDAGNLYFVASALTCAVTGSVGRDSFGRERPLPPSSGGPPCR